MKNCILLIITTCALLILAPVNSYGQSTRKIDNQTVEKLIDSKLKLDQSGDLKDRYTIQIYYGERMEATKSKKAYEALRLQWKCDLSWESPNLAVRVGKFRNRLEADQALLIVREQFPNAIVMKP